MAEMTMHITVKFAWWVRPYIFLATTFMRSIAPFVDLDEDDVKAFADRCGGFIARYGIRYYAGGKRV